MIRRITLAVICVAIGALTLVRVAARPAGGTAAGAPMGWPDSDRAAAAAQEPENDRIRVTDASQLEAMGFPADANNVYVHAGVFSKVRPPESATPSFGFGAGSNYTSIAAKSFIGRQDIPTSVWEYNGGDAACCLNLSRKGGENFADSEFNLPPGVALQSVRYWAHDANAAQDMSFLVFETCLPASSAGSNVYTLVTQGTTTGSAGFQSGLLAGAGFNVNNRDCTFTARLRFDDTVNLTFQKLRVEWRRQIAGAPAVATFVDVPTGHFFFRFIEALAATGITAGCGPGPTYCPDNPVTRAQMAVFLSVALGLNGQ